MVVLEASIETHVPIQFADEVWSEFIRRSMYGSYAKGFADVAASLYEIDADDGIVTFDTVGDGLVRVTVEIEYAAHAGGSAAADIARAQTHLEQVLERYCVFLHRRCHRESSASA